MKWKLLSVVFCLPVVVYATPPKIEVGFSPDGTSLPLVLKVINSAKSSLCLAAYSFTSKPVAEAIYAAYRRGVIVNVVADAKANQSKYSSSQYLASHGVNVRLNSNYAIMHNKFIVVDKQTVETGSFNYSQAAVVKNAENVIVIWNNPDVAAVYNNQCNRLFNEATPFAKSY